MLTRRAAFLAGCAPLAASAQWKAIFDRLGGGRTSADKNAAGIREALLTGVTKAISSASRLDGFFANLAIKILLPEKLRTVERALRLAGGGALMDELVLGMNRAAEKAAPLAKTIFVDAIKSMSIQDAIGIVRGNATAATDFFRRTSEDKLIAAFRPPIADSMQQVGVVKTYDTLLRRLKAIPFVRVESLNLEDYVTAKAVSGLFYLIAEEEKNIRTNPAARITPILQEVFGAIK